MEPMENSTLVKLSERPQHEWAGLIRKLRWIGFEDEARRLEQAVSTLPPEERGSVSVGPFSTDLVRRSRSVGKCRRLDARFNPSA